MAAFYTGAPSRVLRFGDVVTGFQAAALRMDSPGSTGPTLDLQIHLSQPKYFVVMTPCCSIETQSLTLAPLEQLRNAFLSLTHLWDDLTAVNVQMPAERAIPPAAWDHFGPAQKAAKMAEGVKWVFIDCFIYEPHELFETYTLRKGKASREFRHRLVDFRKIFRVDCSQIDRGHDAPAGVKLLQLSDVVRGQLREKLAYFFGRPPDEDLATLPGALVKPSMMV